MSRGAASRVARRELAHNDMLDRAYEAASHRRMTAADIEFEQRARRIEAALEQSRLADERTRAWIEGRIG